MTDLAYLFHSIPPDWLGGAPTLMVMVDGQHARRTTLEELISIGIPIVTYRRGTVARAFVSKGLPLPLLVSMEVAARLAAGMPRNGVTELPYAWDIVSRVSISIDFNNCNRIANIMCGLADGGEECVADLSETVLNGLAEIWKETETLLRKRGEIDRFWHIEVPVDCELQKAECMGIGFNTDRRESHYSIIRREYYRMHHTVAIGNGIDVDRALHDSDYLLDRLDADDDVRTWATGLPARDVVKYLADWDDVCGALHALSKLHRDRRVLDQLGLTDDGVVSPEFECTGTVTSRIMMKTPSLQNLSKRFRDVVVAREGRDLVYVDYDAFEPHILAVLSRDETLLQMCQSGDPYIALASVLGFPDHRREFKSLFLAYSYGMGPKGLAAWTSKLLASPQERGVEVSNRIFELFGGVEEWKKGIYHTLRSEGRIGTNNGNFRYRRLEGELHPKEMRWAVSQAVQGTGALILKKALLGVRNNIQGAALLLPMHDAALFEVPCNVVAEHQQLILHAFRRAAAEVLNGVEIPVSLEPFAAPG